MHSLSGRTIEPLDHEGAEPVEHVDASVEVGQSEAAGETSTVLLIEDDGRLPLELWLEDVRGGIPTDHLIPRAVDPRKHDLRLNTAQRRFSQARRIGERRTERILEQLPERAQHRDAGGRAFSVRWAVHIPDLQRTSHVTAVTRQKSKDIAPPDAPLGQHVVELITLREKLGEPVASPPRVLAERRCGERHQHRQHPAVHSESIDRIRLRYEVECPSISAIQMPDQHAVEFDGQPHEEPPSSHLAESSTPASASRSKTLRM